MQIRKEIELYDLEDFNYEDVYHLFTELSEEEKIHFVIKVLYTDSHKYLNQLELLRAVLNDLGIEEARNILDTLNSEFLTLEEYREKNRKFYEEAK